jgi:hypothetical protein
MQQFNTGALGQYNDLLEGLAGVQRYATGQAAPPPPVTAPAPPPGPAVPVPAGGQSLLPPEHPLHPRHHPHHPGGFPPGYVHLATVPRPPHPGHPFWGWGNAPLYGPALYGPGPGPYFAAPPGGGIAYGGAPAVVERPLRDMREFPLGFFQSGILPVMGAIDVVSRPQIVFRGERLVVPSSIASFFALIDIKVGNRSQLANSTALPAQTFAENAVGVRLALDTAVVAQDIALVVENVDPAESAETFIAALIGTAAQ